MNLVDELKKLWGYSEDEALMLIKKYKLLGEISGLEAVISAKEAVLESCQLL